MDNVWILAQTDSNQAPSQILSEPVTAQEEMTTQTADPNTQGPAGTRQKQGSPFLQFLPLILIFVVMYLLLMRGPRKQQQKHKQMVQTLKKNDRVRTIGGIMGTVVDVRDDEVTLKIDESNNTKIRISTSAVGKNLSEEGKD
ncbi:MAG: preprotein translocase subunit YajC [Sedimentisphaerales bacterium]|nr:preprotein translocase subunit YajC [Sedimentisphaerales bacterium]